MISYCMNAKIEACVLYFVDWSIFLFNLPFLRIVDFHNSNLQIALWKICFQFQTLKGQFIW